MRHAEVAKKVFLSEHHEPPDSAVADGSLFYETLNMALTGV
jgi:hypothetical protein